MMFPRSTYVARLARLKDTDLIKVVTGVRRCGKSTLLRLYAKWLRGQGVASEQILQIDLDDKRNESLLDKDALYEHVAEQVRGGGRHYVFLDEIQMVKDFNLTLNSLKSFGNTDIYITGSNSKLLSSEIGTLLTGRHIDLHLWPLSFSEFHEVDGNAYSQEDSFARYLRYGGFPGAYGLLSTDGSLVSQYIRTLMQDIVTKDILVRKQVQNIDALTRLAAFLGSTVGSPVSSKNIAQVFASERLPISHNTVLDYIGHLNESYLYSQCSRYNIAGKEVLRTHYKEYAVDNALIDAFGPDRNIGYRLENLVYNELRARGYEVYAGKLYNGEVDFVAVKDHEPLYVQVCYLLADEGIIEREFGAFKPIKDSYPKIVLSMDRFDFGRNGIRHHSISDWLLTKAEEME
jgi:predicted AAA+ superfamily ATPase